MSSKSMPYEPKRPNPKEPKHPAFKRVPKDKFGNVMPYGPGFPKEGK